MEEQESLRACPPPHDRTPLLPPSAPPPKCGRCLLLLTGGQLFAIVFVLFAINLTCARLLEEWTNELINAFMVDVCYVLFFVASFAFSILTIVAFVKAGHTVCSVPLYITVFVLCLTTSWYLLVRICLFRSLTVTCWNSACLSDNGSPELSGFAAFFLSWLWVPVGAFSCIAGIIWRPWWLIFYVLPLFIEHGSATIAWWQWREVIIGTALWVCLVFFALALSPFAGESTERRWCLVVLFVLLSILMAGMVFWLTTTPVLTFWEFLITPWAALFVALFTWTDPDLSVEEYFAVVVMGWWLVRMLYLAASARMEQWSASQRIEQVINYALETPFHAEFEQGFEAYSPGLRTLREISGHFLGPAQLNSIKAKHEDLVRRRRELLQESVAGAASLPMCLRLDVCRSRLLEDSCLALYDRPTQELLAPKIHVSFKSEAGLDGGGLTRDWFDSMSKALHEGADDLEAGSLLVFGQDHALIPRPSVSDVSVAGEDQEKFRFLWSVGRFIAVAIFHKNHLPLSFSYIVCKYFLKVPVSMRDVQQLDPVFYKNRVEQVLKEGGVDEMETMLGEPLFFMSAPTEHRPQPEELKPDGANIRVTEENKTEYIQLLCEAYLCGGIRREIQCLLLGFWDVFPAELLQQCKVNPRELSVMISGNSNLDPEQWRACSNSGNCIVQTWFWEVVAELEPEQRSLLLHFATGSSRLPIGGFAALQPTFSLEVSSVASPQHLPISHTCSNQIILSKYTSKEQLQQKLKQAIMTEGFGFA